MHMQLRKSMKKLLLIFAALPAFAQQANWFATTGAVSLSSAATAATIQQPATNADQMTLDSVVVVCPAACTITQTQGGTVTTTLSATMPAGILPYQASTFALKFYTASNQSGGTVVGAPIVCAAACVQTIIGAVFGQPILSSIPAANLYTVSISAVTGTAYIAFYGRRL